MGSEALTILGLEVCPPLIDPVRARGDGGTCLPKGEQALPLLRENWSFEVLAWGRVTSLNLI